MVENPCQADRDWRIEESEGGNMFAVSVDVFVGDDHGVMRKQ